MQDQASSLRRLHSRPARAPSYAFVGASGSGITTLVTELAIASAQAGSRPFGADCQPGQLLARRRGVATAATLESQATGSGGLSDMLTASHQGVLLVNLYAKAEQRARFSPQLWLKL